MAISLVDLLGFGSDRAIANAGQEMVRRSTEERLIDDLVDALARHDGGRCPSGQRPGRGTTMHGPTDLSRPWRLDYTISDRPGALTAAVQALGELGITVGTCDVRPGATGEAVVGGTVALPPWLDVPAVEYALRCAGATDVRAVPVRCATGDHPAGGHGGASEFLRNTDPDVWAVPQTRWCQERSSSTSRL